MQDGQSELTVPIPVSRRHSAGAAPSVTSQVLAAVVAPRNSQQDLVLEHMAKVVVLPDTEMLESCPGSPCSGTLVEMLVAARLRWLRRATQET